jgi:dihydrofolate reductase
MPRITVTEYVSLDGVFDEPGQWSFPFWTEDAAKWKYDELVASDAQLLGRVTYEGFAAAWPTMTDEAGFADRMNGMPKYVVSSTLTDPSWTNTKVITVDEITRLPDENVLVAGSGQLVDTLFREGLVDEVRLLVHPIVLGGGTQLFKEGLPTTSLTLEDQQTFSSGLLALIYRRPAA